MELSPPETFIAFLQAIIEAETAADLWKAKLFYFSPQEIMNFIRDSKLTEKDERKQTQPHENIVSIESLFNLMPKLVKESSTYNSTDSQKVISKYFGFTQSSTSPTNRFLQRLKPTDNKLILGIQKHSLKLDESLSSLLSCILTGYDKIKLKRQQCAANIHSILSYFHSQMCYYKGLSKEALKDITFEANIYGRISFTYLREYIFGHDQEIIGWETLFGVKIGEGIEQIEELSEENIVSEQFIRQKKPKLYTPSQKNISQCSSDLTPNGQSMFIESVSLIKGVSEPVSVTKILPNEDYTKVLSQIDQIESLLNKTKERYQKNRQDLQNETHVIRTQHLKRSQNIGKFSSGLKNVAKYESLKFTECRERVDSPVQANQEQKINKMSKASIQQETSQVYKVSSPYKALKTNQNTQQISTIRPLITRQQMRRQINQTFMDPQVSSCLEPDQKTSRSRQAGKIKRRSVSKDMEKVEDSHYKGKKYSENIKATNYSEYEAVLMEIKREENKFKKMVEDRQKILYNRGEVKTASKVHRKSPSYVSSTGDFITSKHTPQRDSKTFTFQNTINNSRYNQTIRQFDNINTLSRSRVSSKKREQIVQKATSEARLRIQDIESRALKRIAKIDTDIHDKHITKHSSYLVIEPKDRIKTEKNKLMKENTPQVIISQKLPQSKNLFTHDLLNQRPSVKLSISSIYQHKF